jgi:hypothetical protein
MKFNERDITTHVEKKEWSRYFQTATELYDSMMTNYREKRFRAAGIDAIHMAISTSDALMISMDSHKAIRHAYSITLLKNRLKTPKGLEAAKAFEKIISEKTRLEYDGGDLDENSAKLLIEKAELLYSFASERLK